MLLLLLCKVEVFARLHFNETLQVLRVLPRGVQDWLYARLARNRYRWFGRAQMCALPDERFRARLMRGSGSEE